MLYAQSQYRCRISGHRWCNVWTRHYLADQGVYLPSTTIYQDNKSTILLAENGNMSSGIHTCRLNVWCFFDLHDLKKVSSKWLSFNRTICYQIFYKTATDQRIQINADTALNLPAHASSDALRSVMSQNQKLMTAKFVESNKTLEVPAKSKEIMYHKW